VHGLPVRTESAQQTDGIGFTAVGLHDDQVRLQGAKRGDSMQRWSESLELLDAADVRQTLRDSTFNSRRVSDEHDLHDGSKHL
jgi:hypothetical protein